MAYLGREAAKAALVTSDIPDDSITSAKIVDATILAADLAANSVDSSELVDGSVDLSHMSVNSVDSNQYVDASIDLAHMSSESVDEDNLHISNAGSNGEFLSKQSGNAGGLTWAAAGGGTPNVPMFRANYLVANGLIQAANDTFTKFANDREIELDSDGSASTSMFDEENKRYTPDTAGYYYFVVQCGIDDVSDGAAVGSSLWINGANVRNVEIRIGHSSGTKATSCSSIQYMNGSSDYVEGMVKHNDGSTRTVIGGAYAIFAGYKLGT